MSGPSLKLSIEPVRADAWHEDPASSKIDVKGLGRGGSNATVNADPSRKLEIEDATTAFASKSWVPTIEAMDDAT
jgi:hypothetical protein